MSLTTGKRLSRRQWTDVPMPDSVVAAVEARAEAEKQPLIEGGCPKFEWRPNLPFPAADLAANPAAEPLERGTYLDTLAEVACDILPIPVLHNDLDSVNLRGDDNNPIVDFGPQHHDLLSDDDDSIVAEDAPLPPVVNADATAVVRDAAAVAHDVLPADPQQNAVSDDEASDTHGHAAVSEERAAVHAKDAAHDDDDSEERAMARALYDDEDDNQDADFVGAGNPGDYDDGDDGVGNGEDGVDNPADTAQADVPDEGDELPWDEASCAEDPPPPQPMPRYNLRPAWDRSYGHRLATHMNMSSGTKSYDPHVQLLQLASNNMETCPGDMFSYIFGFMMNQMTASQGIRKHGQKAVDALFSEFCQLDDKAVFDLMDASTLMKDQKKAALRAVNLIKE